MAKTVANLPTLTLRDVINRTVRPGDPISREAQAGRIGCNTYTLYQWLSGKRLPSDELMLSLCACADFDAQEGLLLLNVWRSTGRAKTIYIKLLHRLGNPNILRVAPDIVETSKNHSISKTATVNAQ